MEKEVLFHIYKSLSLCESADGSIELQEFLGMAQNPKISRLSFACEFLTACTCLKIADSLLIEDFTEPSRSLVNGVLDKLKLTLTKHNNIDSQMMLVVLCV